MEIEKVIHIHQSNPPRCIFFYRNTISSTVHVPLYDFQFFFVSFEFQYDALAKAENIWVYILRFEGTSLCSLQCDEMIRIFQF